MDNFLNLSEPSVTHVQKMESNSNFKAYRVHYISEPLSVLDILRPSRCDLFPPSSHPFHILRTQPKSSLCASAHDASSAQNPSPSPLPTLGSSALMSARTNWYTEAGSEAPCFVLPMPFAYISLNIMFTLLTSIPLGQGSAHFPFKDQK